MTPQSDRSNNLLGRFGASAPMCLAASILMSHLALSGAAFISGLLAGFSLVAGTVFLVQGGETRKTCPCCDGEV